MTVEHETVPILLYHSVSETTTHRYARFAFSPAVFAEHMAYLADQRYTPLTVSDFVARSLQGLAAMPYRPVVLTFDDGLHDFATGALPVLAGHRFPATLYVTAGYVGKTSRWLAHAGEGGRPMLTWDDLRDVADSGIECGGHGWSHVELDTVPVGVACDEIRSCKTVLEWELGCEVPSFAYPFGYSSARVRALVREAGFQSACAVGQALSSLEDDPFRLARLALDGETSVDDLAAILSDESIRQHAWPEGVRTRLWRSLRLARARLGRGQGLYRQHSSDQPLVS